MSESDKNIEICKNLIERFESDAIWTASLEYKKLESQGFDDLEIPEAIPLSFKGDPIEWWFYE